MNTSFQRTVGSDEWYTPPELIGALGPFDLDPCAPEKPLFRTAAVMYDKRVDGLAQDWGNARVWLNPPYSHPLMERFCARIAGHGNGIALVFSRTGNKILQEILFPNADAVLFMRHRVKFYLPNGKRGGSPGCDSALFAFGDENVFALERSGIPGVLLRLKR